MTLLEWGLIGLGVYLIFSDKKKAPQTPTTTEERLALTREGRFGDRSRPDVEGRDIAAEPESYEVEQFEGGHTENTINVDDMRTGERGDQTSTLSDSVIELSAR